MLTSLICWLCFISIYSLPQDVLFYCWGWSAKWHSFDALYEFIVGGLWGIASHLPTIIAIFRWIFHAFIWYLLQGHPYSSPFSSISVPCDALCYLSQWWASPKIVFSYLYLSSFSLHYAIEYQAAQVWFIISCNFIQPKLAALSKLPYPDVNSEGYFLEPQQFYGAFLIIFYSIFRLPQSRFYIRESSTKVMIFLIGLRVESAHYALNYR